MNAPFVFSDWMQVHQQRIAAALDNRLTFSLPAGQLVEAMRYATLSGGKRLRAMLVYAAGEAVGAAAQDLDAPACAVEMIHSYSLIHDDMPSMDNDDLRRGQPTCHRAFGEATAMLAGDALQTQAFVVLSDNHLDPAQQIAMVNTLATASGALGMAGGQAIDLAAVGHQLSLTQLQQMHQLKTGALIRASVRLGALSAPQTDARTLTHLDDYAAAIGLAFQVQDDVLDVIAETTVLGKQQGADQALNKPTYPALLGLQGAQEKARHLIQQAENSLQQLPFPCPALSALAQYVITRKF